VTSSLPTIQRVRPTDATGLFWLFVLLLAGPFYSQIFPGVGIVFLAAMPFLVSWQFKKWQRDSSINRQATAWCQQHYPTYGGTPVVDFIVALAHDTACDFTQLTPSILLDDVKLLPENYADNYWSSKYTDRQAWLADLVADARIRQIDFSAFSGATLHDAIQFVAIPRQFE
jgi:hypothetical protein